MNNKFIFQFRITEDVNRLKLLFQLIMRHILYGRNSLTLINDIVNLSDKFFWIIIEIFVYVEFVLYRPRFQQVRPGGDEEAGEHAFFVAEAVFPSVGLPAAVLEKHAREEAGRLLFGEFWG